MMNYILKIVTFFLFLFCFVISKSQTVKPLSPVGLRCDLIEHTDRVFVNGEVSQIPFDEAFNIVEPFQIAFVESKHPVLSWAMQDARTGIEQTTFQILIATTREKLSKNRGDIWDSRKVISKRSQVKYTGDKLDTRTNYFWKVKVWDNFGEVSEYSNVKGFRTGDVLKDYNSSYYPLQQSDVKPVFTKKIKPGLQFFDFGKAGFGRVKVTIASLLKNDTLAVSFGEVIDKRGRIESEPGGSRRYRKVLVPLLQGVHTYTVSIEKDSRNTRRAAIKLPDYIGDVYPFRYCETEGDAEVISIVQEVVAYPFNDYSSSFECSDPVLNDIWEFCKYSIKATSFTGIYVDGDRERIPYEADAYINQLCHYGVDNEYTLARRSQEYMLHKPTWPTEWILSSVLLAWADYVYTGNDDFIRHYYNDLKAKSFISLTEKNGLISTRTGKLTKKVQESIYYHGKSMRDIVDWPHSGILGLSKDDSGETDGFVFTDYNTVVNAYHYKALIIMSEIAKITGNEVDREFFSNRATELKGAFNKLLFDKTKGYYNDGIDTDHSSLHANMFALTFGLVPEEHTKTVTDFVKSRGMACSVYGSQHLLDAVYKGEDADYGMSLLTATHDRGWAHAIYDVGTTISLEAWDNKYKPNQDWNHAWGAAPANIIPRRLMGIEPLEPGFERIRIKPQPANLEWAKFVQPTIAGDVKVSFTNKVNENFNLEIEIPANTKSEVWIPFTGKKYELKIDGNIVEAKRVRNFLVIKETGSGKHLFELKYL